MLGRLNLPGKATARAGGRIATAVCQLPTKRSVKMQAVDQTLNPRVAGVKPSKTMALADLATTLREQGKDIIGLAAGEPDFDTPAEIVEAGMEALRKGYTRYTPNSGSMALRKAICKKLKDDNGLTYTPAEVLVSNGAKQALWQSVLATCSEGDEVIIPAPYWVSYTEMARLAGAVPVVVDLDPDEGFLLTAEKLRAAITPKSRLLLLCTPSNPTGAVYPKAALEAIAEVVREHPRLVVISDEIYEYITYKPAVHISFGTLPGMWERTLTVNGFSKAYAMTGWRLGYMAGPAHFVNAAAIIQSQSTSGASSIAQHAGIAALNLGPGAGEPGRRMLAAYEERKNMIVAKFRAIPGVKLVDPQGAFYVLPEMSAFFGPGAKAEGFGDIPDSDAFGRYLIEKALVAVVPGDAFGAPNCIRISYAASLEKLEEGMNRLVRALDPSIYTRRTGA